MGIEDKIFFQVVTRNEQRANAMQQALPGGKSVHLPFGQVDEQRAKTIQKEAVSVVAALLEAERVARYKAWRDWKTTGGVTGAVKQLDFVNKPLENEHGFTHVARFTADSIQLVYEEDGSVRVFNKMSDRDLFSLHEQISGRKTAIVTAIAGIVAPIGEDRRAHLETALAITQYTLNPIEKDDYFRFISEQTVSKLREIAGGVPFVDNRFVNTSEPYNVLVLNRQSGLRVLRTGDNWKGLDRKQCVHGAFPEVMQPLLTSPGQPFPSQGILYGK